jgi:hypothetical protein
MAIPKMQVLVSGTGANAFQTILDSVSDFGGKLSNEEKGGHAGDFTLEGTHVIDVSSSRW